MTSIQGSIDYSLIDLDTTELENILGISSSSSCAGASFTSSATSGVSEPSPSTSGPEQAGPSTSRSRTSSPTCTSKISRKRVRTKVDLAPGQPPTARGNPRIRVYVACYQWHPFLRAANVRQDRQYQQSAHIPNGDDRHKTTHTHHDRARKIRCDGAKPICHNCQKRPSEAEQCNYDSGPNRRGRERGSARARAPQQVMTAKKQPMRRRSVSGDTDRRTTPTSEDVPDNTQTHVDETLPDQVKEVPPIEDTFFELSEATIGRIEADPLLYDAVMLTDIIQLPIPDIVVTPQQGNQDDEHEQEESIPSQPGAQFARDTWWDALLTFYATERDPGDTDMAVISLSQVQRSAAMKMIMGDLKALFQASPCWVGFLHIPRFFDILFNPVRRHSLQPSLLLSALAIGTFVQSSEVENGARGRQKALKLLEMAHGALEGALATGWVDIGLAQAALLIVCFEMQSHPVQSVHRSRSAILLMDSLMRLFSLATVDEGIKPRGRSPFENLQSTASYAGLNPAAQLGAIPQIAPNNPMIQITTGLSASESLAASLSPGSSFTPTTSLSSSPSLASSAHSHEPKGCNCHALSLGTNWPSVHNVAPAFASTIMWPEGLAEADFHREECRRLVWACVMLVANLHAYIAATPDSIINHGNLFVREPENFALMLPGEALTAAGAIVEADDIWTLSMRTMLLLHVCMRVRENRGISQADRARLSVQAWLDIDDLERRLARHTCDLDTSFGFQAKEFLFGMRMLTSYEFRNFIPQVTTTGSQLFYRDKAEDWLRYTDAINKYIWRTSSLSVQSPSQDHRKSILIFWFIANIRRALMLWKNDPGLIYGLEVSKRFAEHTEYLMMFWPNLRLRGVWQDIRIQLVTACLEAGIPPPSPKIPQIPKAPPAA